MQNQSLSQSLIQTVLGGGENLFPEDEETWKKKLTSNYKRLTKRVKKLKQMTEYMDYDDNSDHKLLNTALEEIFKILKLLHAEAVRPDVIKEDPFVIPDDSQMRSRVHDITRGDDSVMINILDEIDNPVKQLQKDIEFQRRKAEEAEDKVKKLERQLEEQAQLKDELQRQLEALTAKCKDCGLELIKDLDGIVRKHIQEASTADEASEKIDELFDSKSSFDILEESVNLTKELQDVFSNQTVKMSQLEQKLSILGDDELKKAEAKKKVEKARKDRMEKLLEQRRLFDEKIQDKKIELIPTRDDDDEFDEAPEDPDEDPFASQTPQKVFKVKQSVYVSTSKPAQKSAQRNLASFRDASSCVVGTLWKGIQVYEESELMFSGYPVDGNYILQGLLYLPRYSSYCLAMSSRLYRKDIDDKSAYPWIEDLSLPIGSGEIKMSYFPSNDLLVVEGAVKKAKKGVKGSEMASVVHFVKMAEKRAICSEELQYQPRGKRMVVVGFEEVRANSKKRRTEILTVCKNGWLYVMSVKLPSTKTKPGKVKTLSTSLIPLKSPFEDKNAEKNESVLSRSLGAESLALGSSEEISNFCYIADSVEDLCHLCVELTCKVRRSSSKFVVLRLNLSNHQFVTKQVFDSSQLRLSETGPLVYAGLSQFRLMFYRFHEKGAVERSEAGISIFAYKLNSCEFERVEVLEGDVGQVEAARRLVGDDESSSLVFLGRGGSRVMQIGYQLD